MVESATPYVSEDVSFARLLDEPVLAQGLEGEGHEVREYRRLTLLRPLPNLLVRES